MSKDMAYAMDIFSLQMNVIIIFGHTIFKIKNKFVFLFN